MSTARRPARSARPAAAAARRAVPPALLAVLLLAPAACAGPGDAPITGPDVTLVGTTAGGAITPGATTAAALVGRWARVTGSGTALRETTFAFGADGTGARTTATRTVLGAELVVDRQPFTWSAGAGVLLLQLPAGGGSPGVTTLRAAFRVERGVAGTVLLLDGLPYERAGG